MFSTGSTGSDHWFHVAMTLAADGVHDPLAAVPDVGEDGGPAAAGLLGGAVAPGAEHGLQLPHPRLQAHQRGAQVSLHISGGYRVLVRATNEGLRIFHGEVPTGAFSWPTSALLHDCITSNFAKVRLKLKLAAGLSLTWHTRESPLAMEQSMESVTWPL